MIRDINYSLQIGCSTQPLENFMVSDGSSVFTTLELETAKHIVSSFRMPKIIVINYSYFVSTKQKIQFEANVISPFFAWLMHEYWNIDDNSILPVNVTVIGLDKNEAMFRDKINELMINWKNYAH